MAKKFIRRVSGNYSKLGKRRKKLQVWRRPTGRDNKMREKRKGVPAIVSVGYKRSKKDLGKINGKTQVVINTIADLKKVGKEDIGVLQKMGIKKKLDIAKESIEKSIEFSNFNAKKFIKNTKLKKKKETKK